MERSYEARQWLLRGSLAAGALALAACSSSSSVGVDGGLDGGGQDARTGTDAKTHKDAPTSHKDAPSGKDAPPGTDAPTTTDSGLDAAHDTGIDAAHDAGLDASGPLTLTAVTPTTASAFIAIFDAVPSSAGSTIYFTAATSSGAIGVYSVPVAATLQIPTLIASGLVAPLGIAISDDDATLYVTDQGALDSGGNEQLGVIFTVPASAGTPVVLAGTAGFGERGIALASVGGVSTLFFTGTDAMGGKPGVFSIPAAGGSVSVVAEGAPFVDPMGVAVDGAGNVYALDTGPASTLGNVIKVTTTGSVYASGLFFGYPAGVAVASDGTTVVVSNLAALGGPDTIVSIAAVDATPAPFITAGLSATLNNGAGLHRASKSNVYAFVDSAGDGTDAVYVAK